MGIQDKVRTILQKAFPDSKIELAESNRGQISGQIVSSSWLKSSHYKRQELIWSELSKALSKEEQLTISSLLPLTPDEEQALRALPIEAGAPPSHREEPYSA